MLGASRRWRGSSAQDERAVEFGARLRSGGGSATLRRRRNGAGSLQNRTHRIGKHGPSTGSSGRSQRPSSQLRADHQLELLGASFRLAVRRGRQPSRLVTAPRQSNHLDEAREEETKKEKEKIDFVHLRWKRAPRNEETWRRRRDFWPFRLRPHELATAGRGPGDTHDALLRGPSHADVSHFVSVMFRQVSPSRAPGSGTDVTESLPWQSCAAGSSWQLWQRSSRTVCVVTCGAAAFRPRHRTRA